MDKQLAQRYIRMAKAKARPYCIDEKMQPHFWDAVLALCEDSTQDIYSLIDIAPENQNCVVMDTIRMTHHSVEFYPNFEANTLQELIHKIADEIIRWDSMSLDDIKLILFEMTSITIAEIIRRTDKLTASHNSSLKRK